MPNELPYLPFFVGDFLVTVGTWPAERVGAYALALFYQFENGGLPANDEAELARIFHVPRPTARRLWMAIGGKFHQRGDGLWWNPRLEEVRTTARAQVAKAANRAKKGAAARWGKGANAAQAHAQALLGQSLSNANQNQGKEVPPKPPAAQGASRKPRSRRPTRHTATGDSQREKTAERDRLIAGGMSRDDANRAVGW